MRKAKADTRTTTAPPKRARRSVLQSEFIEALRRVEKKRGINLLERVFERALKSDTVLVAVLKKLVPDLKAFDMRMDLLVRENQMSEDEVNDIRSKLVERFRSRRTAIASRLEETEVDFVDVNPLPANVAGEVFDDDDDEDE